MNTTHIMMDMDQLTPPEWYALNEGGRQREIEIERKQTVGEDRVGLR